MVPNENRPLLWIHGYLVRYINPNEDKRRHTGMSNTLDFESLLRVRKTPWCVHL